MADLERWQLVVHVTGIDPHVLTYSSEVVARDKLRRTEARRDDWIRFNADADGRGECSIPRERIAKLEIRREHVAPVVPMEKRNGDAAAEPEPEAAEPKVAAPQPKEAPKEG